MAVQQVLHHALDCLAIKQCEIFGGSPYAEYEPKFVFLADVDYEKEIVYFDLVSKGRDSEPVVCYSIKHQWIISKETKEIVRLTPENANQFDILSQEFEDKYNLITKKGEHWIKASKIPCDFGIINNEDLGTVTFGAYEPALKTPNMAKKGHLYHPKYIVLGAVNGWSDEIFYLQDSSYNNWSEWVPIHGIIHFMYLLCK